MQSSDYSPVLFSVPAGATGKANPQRQYLEAVQGSAAAGRGYCPVSRTGLCHPKAVTFTHSIWHLSKPFQTVHQVGNPTRNTTSGNLGDSHHRQSAKSGQQEQQRESCW